MDKEAALAKSIDVYMTCILSTGNKSLSHVLSTIDRCKDRLLAVTPTSEPTQRQIVSSVVEYWHEHPGTAVNIIDKLLNYTIVTPMSVIRWALDDSINHGKALANPQIYELISITMFKVTNRVHQLLRHRNNIAMPFEQRQQVDEALPREHQGMRELFQAIEDPVASVAAGSQDGMMEAYEGDESELDYVKAWGARWARVWRRKSAVEEVIFAEGMALPMDEPAAVPLPMDVGDEGLGEEDMDQVS